MERKVKAGLGIGAPLSLIITWMWNGAMPDVQMPAEVGAAFGAVITSGIAWLVPNAK